ncbi:hypothetical protein CON65_05885 [Bacillus pseudomycoides]|uniref:Uncharacterized protein n=1 Tax=Bacillus pseudomycoides TaxID=64104 RepID=A0AA91VED3_9BACI|nr:MULTISPECIES: DUF5986 family protein [Bacillus]PEB56976.1 hypothetical protein COO03_00310 [Bacillus sp. AFS098217]PED83404.1 hypothetical protein CON65_05885 [Bacillus pseudomycoides]PEU14946.1 hypothetical protein CN525_18120 [Bacillus sp. AFS014408]PEU15340.1 hypothetical protein CN524_07210 [Bacillus sp. AFS019443]PFW61084.1 hypothetical protein COL20_19135 [Bacillus sp. AFS075034]
MASIDSDTELLKKMTHVFSKSCVEELNDIKAVTGGATNNGRNQNIWDVKYSRLHQLALETGNIPVHIKRNALWECVTILENKTGELFLFFRDNNYKKILRDLGKKPYHYLDCVLVKNKCVDNEAPFFQTDLFDDTSYDDEREEQSKEILGDRYDQVNKIIVFTLEEEKGIATAAKAILLTSNGEVIDEVNLSKYMPTNYSNSAAINDDTPERTIVKLKAAVKNSNEKIDEIKLSKKAKEESE